MANTEAQTIADIVSATKPMTAPVGGFMAVPEGYSVESLERLQERPNRMRADYTFRDTGSLAAYLDRFEAPESIAFSSPANRRIRVVIDHHDHAGKQAAHGEHVASFCGQFTPQYRAWRDIHGKGMSQVDAGMFLEERAVDVAEPDAASIMDMVMTFDALKRVTFKQSTRLHDGQRQFMYTEENEARGNVTLPERMTLLVPVFDGQDPDRIPVRVKYRIDDGALRFIFEIHDRQNVEDTAFRRCEDALCADRPDLLLVRTI